MMNEHEKDRNRERELKCDPSTSGDVVVGINDIRRVRKLCRRRSESVGYKLRVHSCQERT